jgi:iron-sulfur cluster assembly protein
MVTLTERAAEHVLALMSEDPEALALRVAVQGGGCSGMQYALGFDGEPQPGDEVVDQHGVKIVVDRFSLPYLSGAEVDFVDGLMGQGFTVNNPNAVASCGCGSSFKAEGD